MDTIDWDNAFDSVFGIPDSPLLSNAVEYDKLFFQPTDGQTQPRYYRDPPPQVLTPPASESGSVSGGEDTAPESDAQESTVVSVSTTFHPSAGLLPISPDLVLVSSDDVHFYAHTTQVLAASANHFDNIVPPQADQVRVAPDKTGDGRNNNILARVADAAAVLNVVLHCVYGLSCAQYKPALGTLVAAVDAMPAYGLSPEHFVSPSTPLYALILAQAPVQPLTTYALAARHDLHALAQAVSSHLLAFPVHAIPDDVARQIGARYLQRLYALHAARVRTLKELLPPAPHPHPPTAACDFAAQRKLTRAWTLAAAYLAWEAHPDVSPSAIESALAPLADHLPCELCKQSLAARIRQLLVQWSFVKRTI
ncbi:hypothetical protein OH77DRAFT_1518801 [Trametes cingulata]|nr:hypothetical protein OH77DRAFT_1518801 [Trametes cingulata]